MIERPQVIVFDVNETLSDTSALARRFEEVGAPGELAGTWFAQVLRDGFALTATGGSAPFAEIAVTLLDAVLGPVRLTRPYEEAKRYLVDSFAGLPLHPDVAPGVRALSAAGLRLATLTNGAAATAATLLASAGIDGCFERVLSVEDAPSWKPGADAYRWAAERCGVDPSEMLLVAVHAWDIHGADRAGLRTAWVNRDSRPYPAYFIRAQLEVSSVADLARQVR
ncbi:MAG: haloacid dehalogenase type II [Janthinobacterium lividum]